MQIGNLIINLMKKYLFLFVGLMIAVSSHSRIKCEVNKYGVMSVYFVYSDSLPTIGMFWEDCESAINTALVNKKVSQVQFKNIENNVIFWVQSDRFKYWRAEFEKVVKEFSKFDVVEAVGDSILVTSRTPAKYHSDTYKNGVLLSTYTSDWDGKSFTPRTSEYVSRGDRFVTKTYVTPQKSERNWEVRIKERRIVKKGEDVKLLEIYKKDM